MVKHIVCFLLKDHSPEHRLEVKNKLMSLEGKVEQLRSIEVGIDYLASERSYDLALICTFDSPADLEAYRVHPEHVKVQAYIHSVRDGSVSVDFEY